MIFDRCHSKCSKSSIKQHTVYFNFLCTIQLDHPVVLLGRTEQELLRLFRQEILPKTQEKLRMTQFRGFGVLIPASLAINPAAGRLSSLKEEEEKEEEEMM